MIDTNLNWKSHIKLIAKKMNRNIGLLSKIRYYVFEKIRVNLYYSLIFPYLTYGIVAWGNTYTSTLNPIVILQKRVIRMITFSDYNEHTSPLFKKLNICKLSDLAFLYTANCMHDFAFSKLPSPFDNFFVEISKAHHYNTRLASRSSYSLPRIRTNYGKFNIRFQGPKIWNSLDEKIKASNRLAFKRKLMEKIIYSY